MPNSAPSNRMGKSQTSSSDAAPAGRRFFDPWNSSSTGHQCAENRLTGSTSSRTSRNLKLHDQFKDSLAGGQKRVADTADAGSQNYGKDGRKADGGWKEDAKSLRISSQPSLAEVWGASKANETLPQEKQSAAKVCGMSLLSSQLWMKRHDYHVQIFQAVYDSRICTCKPLL